MRDIHSTLQDVVILPAAAYNADNTPGAVDLQGFEAAEVAISVGVGGITFSGTNKVEFVLTHSSDNVSYTNVTDDDVIGVTGVTGGIIKSLIAAHATPSVYSYGYRGGKRYLKLLADFSGTHGTATPMSAIVIKGYPHNAPVA